MAHKRKSTEQPNVSKSGKIQRVDDDSEEPYSAKGQRVDEDSKKPYSAKGQRVDDDSEEPYSAKGQRVDEDSKKPYSAKGQRVHDDSEKPFSAKGRRVHDVSEQPYSAIGQLVDDDSKKPYSAKGRRVDEDSKKPYSAKGRRVDEEETTQSANARIAQLSAQLENERKANEDALISLKQDKRRIEEESKRIKAKNNQFTNQLENERKAKEDAFLSQQSANARIAQLSAQLENERKAKENALIRLSSLASNKLRDNNPNIADLSDPNRPTKLSEQFSELYDNEWTDAFDDLQKMSGDKEDKEVISKLLCFVLEINSVCRKLSASKLDKIQKAFANPAAPSDENKVPPETFKSIKDGIKSIAPKLLEDVKVHVHNHLKAWLPWESVSGCLQSENVKRYIDKCTEVCWYMSVQDPQLVMEGDKSPDGKFDSSKHREYTKKGPFEEFVVWPVLYLYQGGPLLFKGVAQGSKLEIK